MKFLALLGSIALITSSASAQNGFTGFSVVRTITAAGNTQYKVYGNWSTASSFTIVNAFDFNVAPGASGTMNARHQDAAEDAAGDPSQSWSANYNFLGSTARENDSWVTMTGLGTSAGNDTSLDPAFTPSDASYIPVAAGWFDATPGAANLTGASLMLLQIVRAGNDNTNGMGMCISTLKVGFKVTGTTTAISGSGSFTIGGPDADGDGVLDPVDNCPTIANSNQLNTDGDSQGNACDADDDNDGVLDTVDNCSLIANPPQTDCNTNGVGDVCETGFPDCNSDGVPDTCQGAILFASTSPNLGAPSGTEVRTFTFTQLNFSESAVQLTIDVSGDLNRVNEWIDVSLNGDLPRRFFEAGGNDCPATPDRAVIDLTREQFAALIGSTGSLTVSVSCPATVDPTECKGAGLTKIGISYVGINPTSGDCDGDRRLDVCAVFQGAVPDCNNNRVPDSCDMASGFAKDCNLNGIPDSCDIASTFAKDCNANTIPDSCDIASGISVDIDGNAKPDECQTTALTSGGNIQGAINSASASELRIVTLGAGTYSGPISITGKAIIIRGAGAANTIIQGTGGASSSVLKMENNPAISSIEGVTIRGGLTGTLYPNTPPQYLLGGGIFMLNSACSIRNCIIESNAAGFGGGAYALECTGTISNCIFRNNNASTDGGGIQLSGGAPKVVDTVVENNLANSRGAGMHVVQGTPELLRVNIRNNVSNNIVGGLSWYGLGSPSAFLKVTSCQVTSNSALVVQGGIGILNISPANISILDSVVCSNVPQPNISGLWENLGGNSVCKCIGDIVENGSVDGSDLAVLISQLQTSGSEPSADLNESGFVDGFDLAILLAAWGTCPSNGSITSITPAVGPTSGGTAITITGIGFGNITSVKFGGIPATNVVATSTTVTAVTPARAAGVVDVAVSGPGQYVVATSAFTYSGAVPPWATLLELAPNPAVVTDANLRAAIVASGFAWRVRDNSSNIEMLLVPGGTFTMGCSASAQYACYSSENPTHQVTLTQPFYMGRYEVTQAQWQAKMGSNPSSFSGYSDSPSRPVEKVSWNMIASGSTSFMSLTGLRLPTEAEWEYAYRAGTTTAFHSYAAQPTGFNDDTLLGNIAWYSSNSGGQTHAVGGKFANGFGLHDMSGNVWEWCQDWYGPYSSASVTNPTGPTTGTYRLLRSGGWVGDSYSCRVSQRSDSGPDDFSGNIVGFRVVRNP